MGQGSVGLLTLEQTYPEHGVTLSYEEAECKGLA